MARANLGVLGGMGPLASAEFLQTIYRLNLALPEQGSPVCIVCSDPTFPDRTAAIVNGSVQALGERLARALESLVRIGATRLIITCVTAHYALPFLPPTLHRKVISLVDLAVQELAAFPRPRLLLASDGTRRARLFESHERWPSVADWVQFPDARHQAELHNWIFRLKSGEPAADCLSWLDRLSARYGTDGFIFGCTEFHLLQRPLAEIGEGDVQAERGVVDPLWIAARDLRKLLH
ncbi:MAG TPA: aspartate/glutamate racemase family protein [Thermoanaerobaculia bacterium]|jgi:aspartate racemase